VCVCEREKHRERERERERVAEEMDPWVRTYEMCVCLREKERERGVCVCLCLRYIISCSYCTYVLICDMTQSHVTSLNRM